jgi:hypothetical protein
VTTRRWYLLPAAAALMLAACGGDDPPAGQAAATTAVTSTTLAPTTSAAPASSTSGSTFRFRAMTLAVPDRWKVDANAGGATVANGQACFHSDLLGRDVCPGFEVHGPDGIAHGYEDRPYRLDQPFHPGTDVSPCTTAPDDALEGGHTLVKGGFAKVGPKTAHYRAWRVTCVSSDGTQPAGKPYIQRIWYLPKSQILVVDEWSTPGLAEALATAQFA